MDGPKKKKVFSKKRFTNHKFTLNHPTRKKINRSRRLLSIFVIKTTEATCPQTDLGPSANKLYILPSFSRLGLVRFQANVPTGDSEILTSNGFTTRETTKLSVKIFTAVGFSKVFFFL